MMNKSLITNLISLLLVIAGLFLTGSLGELILTTGLFALSGGVTNWLAIHMLFEKVPGLYGSGVIPARFEEFKHGIKALIMEQFFNPENINNFFNRLKDKDSNGEDFDGKGSDGKDSAGKSSDAKNDNAGITKLIDSVDLSGAFESLVEVIMESSFGSMLSMLGGAEALKPLKEPFMEKMKEFLSSVGDDQEVMNQFRQASTEAMLAKVEHIVDQRLDELTPELVKDIIQQMIRKHLGWLVVWGGVIGGVIGLLVTLFIA